uniref:Uncharacterized protein n=1 Tax=Vespula pensylvanica TaxID=30213 RepID=A0A834P1B4_VESPE|nr:hypothetical protein H0235_009166 [Vespula pensylvanica]
MQNVESASRFVQSFLALLRRLKQTQQRQPGGKADSRGQKRKKTRKGGNAIAALLQAACLKTWKAARKGCNRDSYGLAGENNRKVRR